MKLTIYLAGDISKQRWRLDVIEALKDYDIEWLSPVDNISYSYQKLIPEHEKRKTFHIADLMKVDEANIIFAYFRKDSPSYYSGTSAECGYAYDKRKHLVLVCDMKPSDECKYEFVKRLADSYYRTLDEGINHLRELVWELNFLPKEG